MTFIQSQRPGYNTDFGIVTGFNDEPDMYMPEERPVSFYQSNRAASKVNSTDLQTGFNSIGSTRKTCLLLDKPIQFDNVAQMNIPANIYFKSIHGNRLEYVSGGGIKFLGRGIYDENSNEPLFKNFPVGGVSWDTGAVIPTRVSTEWWENVGNSLMYGLRRANAAFSSSQVVKIVAYPRTIGATDQIDFLANRHIELMPGYYSNVYTGYTSNGNKTPFQFQSNFSFIMHPGAKLEGSNSTSPNDGGLFRGVNQSAQYEDVYFNNLYIICTSPINSSGTSIISFGNVRRGHLVDSWILNLNQYLVVGQWADLGASAEDVLISRNNIITPRGILLGITGSAKRVRFNDNHIWIDNPGGEVNFQLGVAVLDVEPNQAIEYVEDVEICRNTFYVGDIIRENFNDYSSFLTIQGGQTKGVNGIRINDNMFRGHPVGYTGTEAVTYGVHAYGIQRFEINRNTIEGVYHVPIRVMQARYGEIKDNKILRSPTIEGLNLSAVSDTVVADNNIVKQTQGLVNNNAKIVESEQSHAVDFSGTLLESVFNYTVSPRFYKHYIGWKGIINRQEFEIASTIAGDSEVSYQTASTVASVGTLSTKDFTANSGTDVITWTAGDPKFTTGQALTISNSGGSLPGGLAAGTYFYIKINTTTGKLATTFIRALSNVSVDITSTGSGTHSAQARKIPRKTAVSGDVTIGTETITLPEHPFVTGARIKYNTYGKVPGGLIGGAEQTYYVRDATANSFKIAITPGGTPITPTDGGEGTHTWYHNVAAPSPNQDFTSANISGDTFNITGHNYPNNDPLVLRSVGVPIGGLTDGQDYFVISPSTNATNDTLKLATSEALALSETAINLTSTGAGYHAFTPVFRTKVSNNTYIHNITPDGIELEPTGSSVNYPVFGLNTTVTGLPSGAPLEIGDGMTLGQILSNIQSQISLYHPPTYLLDELSVAPTFAESFRKLSSSYNGYCCRVRQRLSGGSWTDIGFDGLWVDQNAAIAVNSNLEMQFYNQITGTVDTTSTLYGRFVPNILNGKPGRMFGEGEDIRYGNLSGYTSGEAARVFYLDNDDGSNNLFWRFDTDGNANHFPLSPSGDIYSGFGSTTRPNHGNTTTELGITLVGQWHLWQEYSASADKTSYIDSEVLYNTTSNIVGFHSDCYLTSDRLMYDTMFLIFNVKLSAEDRTLIQTEAKKYFALDY